MTNTTLKLTNEIKHEIQYAREDITYFDWANAHQDNDVWEVPVIAYFSDADGLGFSAWMAGNMIIEVVCDELDYFVGDWLQLEESAVPAELF